MNNFLKRLNNFEEYLLVALLPIMCVVIFVATFCRYTNIISLPWAEEFARYCMIWILFLGASAAAKRGEHFCVTAFTMLLPQKVQRILVVVRMFLMAGFTIFVSRFCLVILQNQMMMGQVTPSLKWPMWIMYTAVLVGCVFMLLRYVVFGILELRTKESENKGE